MSKTLLIILFAALYSLHAWPQAISYTRIRGRVTDKDTQLPLENATAALLYAKDSSRATAAFTDKNGAFILNARAGMYQLYITYLGYQQQLKPVTIKTDSLIDLGTIALKKTGVTLGMVEIVEIRAPMVVKKDTLEFNADYYKTRENAVMEELLKKLPGVEVDKDGMLKVNGEPVKRILIEGKPFFGDNPKLAIRNLPADMIDKIQLIDRKSDQAQFSGASDGQREKTVNITVKKEKKNRLLGRLSAGYGTHSRFAASASLNRFGEHPISFLGAGNNVNDAQERSLPIGGYGIMRNWNGGSNYSRDISKTLKISGSYFINSLNILSERISTRQNLLPDTSYYYNQHTTAINNTTNHMSNVQMEYKPDTMHTLSITTNVNYIKGNDSQENVYESLGAQKQLVNSGAISNTSANTAPSISGYIFFGKRFRKPGRTLSSTFSAAYTSNKQQQFNRSHNLFIQPDGDTLQDTINQRNNIRSPTRMLTLNITYTEPLYKDHFLDLVYAYENNWASSEKLTYDFNPAKGVYDHPNDSLSNSFRNSIGLQQGSISMRTVKSRYDYSIGAVMSLNSLNNYNISGQNRLKKNITSFFPVAAFNYTFSSSRRLLFQYMGKIQPPDVTLLQPVPNNNNPLYIQLGNPDLKPTMLHIINTSYTTVNPVTFSNTLLTVNAALFRNRIIMDTRVDSLGRQVSQPLNANGSYTLRVNMANGFPLKKKQLSVNASTMFTLNRDISFTNGQLGKVNTFVAGENVTLNYAYGELCDGALGAGFSYNGARYSLQKENNIDLYLYTLSLSYNITLPLGFFISGNMNYQHNAGIAAGYNADVAMLNASITKNILSRSQGQLKLQGFDLLNRNQGYARTFGANYVEDVQTKVLERFFIFSFTYFLK